MFFYSHLQHYVFTTHKQDHFPTATLQKIVTPSQINCFIAFLWCVGSTHNIPMFSSCILHLMSSSLHHPFHFRFSYFNTSNAAKAAQQHHTLHDQKLFNKLVNGYVGNDSAEVTIPTHVWRRDFLHFHIALSHYSNTVELAQFTSTLHCHNS